MSATPAQSSQGGGSDMNFIDAIKSAGIRIGDAAVRGAAAELGRASGQRRAPEARLALAAFSDLGDWPNALPSMSNLGVMHYWRGEYAAAKSARDRAELLSREPAKLREFLEQLSEDDHA